MARITFQFGTGESGNAYLAQGWTSPQPTFVWATGPVSELVLPVGSASLLRLRLMAFLQPPDVMAQRLGIVVDGVNVGGVTLARLWSALDVKLPPSPNRQRRLELHHPDGRTGNAADPRDLSVALSWVVADLADDDPVLLDDLLVPPAALLMDGTVTAEQFRSLGEGFVWVTLVNRAALQPTEKVLEIGSGNGQKARVLARYLAEGSYDGLDIVPEPVQWCRDRYAHLPNFRFHLADIASSHYRPGGAVPAAHYVLPFADGAFDLVFLCSVFTHMLPDEIAAYMREIARVLRPGGRCVATFFLLHDDVAGWAEPPPMQFSHPHGLARVLDEADPAKGVAHQETWVRRQWREAGMRVAEITLGRWSGAPDRLHALQDAILAVKPG